MSDLMDFNKENYQIEKEIVQDCKEMAEGHNIVFTDELECIITHAITEAYTRLKK